MHTDQWLADHFEQHRPRLRALAYRMLGSLTEADDAVQDTWLRLSRSDATRVENLGGWLTTITARVCLNLLRARTQRREDRLSEHIPDPVVSPDERRQPEDQVVLADSVGLALLIVLDTLSPDERLAFVLHDLFGLPFDEIGALLNRTPAAAKQLGSRARRRVRGAGTSPAPDLARQHELVTAFFAAAREGDLDALVAVLHPGVVLRINGASASTSLLVRGSAAVARQTTRGLRALLADPATELRPVLVNGSAGVVVVRDGRPFALIGFTVAGETVAAVDAITDAGRVRDLVEGPFPVKRTAAGPPRPASASGRGRTRPAERRS
jgi:RNA polymerase sigma factor (sigma-70 family)